MSAISETISEVASGPKSQTVDGQSVVEHGISDLIDAEHHVAESAAKNKSKLPIRMMQVKPGGAV